MSNLRVDELLQRCVVKLSVRETGDVGTGFFIAPGFILTCEHVVRGGQTCSVRYGDSEEFATAEVVGRWADCDVALLAFESPDLPCVMVDGALQPRDELFLFGYPTGEFADGCPVTASFEGIAPGPPREIKFKAGRITQGMSGSPLLNLHTGKVCGMVTFTRDERSDLGGGAVPAADIWRCLASEKISETLRQGNREFHQRDGRWREALPQTEGEGEGQGQVSINQSVEGNQNITVGSISGNPTIIGNQIIENMLLPKSVPTLIGIPSNLQERGSLTFVGRDETLEDLHAKLQTSHTLAITALQGMGGIGKTEMAVQYAQLYKKHYPSGVCWLSARGAEVGAQLVNYAVKVLRLPQPEGSLADQVQAVWNLWPRQDDGERVLLIYDDVADYGDIEGLLPVDERFQVLLTTRLQNLAAGVEDFRLELLNEEASLELLRKIVDKEAGTTRINEELPIAKALCERVGYLPLGLELLGYFLKNRPDMSLVKLERQLERKNLEAQAFQQAHPGMIAKLGVYEAFELSWAELSEEGKKLAGWLSLFALTPIPMGLMGVKSDGTLLDEVEDEDLLDKIENILTDELWKRNLVQRLHVGWYYLHQLLREFFLAKVDELQERNNLKRTYCELLAGVAKGIGQRATQEQTQIINVLIPHITEITYRWKDFLSTESFVYPYQGLTLFYYSQGLFDFGRDWAEESVRVTKEKFGNEHSHVATSLNNLGFLCQAQGHYQRAEPSYLEALKMRKKLLKKEDSEIVSSLLNLAGLYQDQGRYKEAESLYLEIQNLHQYLQGNSDELIEFSLDGLASLYMEQGRYEEAKIIFIRVLDLRKQASTRKDENIAISFNNLAILYQRQERYDEAQKLFIQVLDLRKEIFGYHHLDVAESLNNLAILYLYQNRYKDAEPLFVQSLETLIQVLGIEHPTIASSLNNLANLYESQGDYESAEFLFLNVLELLKKFVNDPHPKVASTMSNLATVYEYQGRYDEAICLFEEVLDFRIQLFGNQHPSVASSINSLARIYCSQEHYEKAEALLIQELKIRKHLFGEYHQKIASSLNNLAVLYSHQKNYGKAEFYYLEALEMSKQLLGKKHPETDDDIYQSYVHLITDAIQANEADTLSDHPMTQDLLPKILAAIESQGD
ncbi:MAG: tetratricopeptide repeat protein [Cyanobacteria bacterium P01_C01_bin.118]